jgi:hypothetical protein
MTDHLKIGLVAVGEKDVIDAEIDDTALEDALARDQPWSGLVGGIRHQAIVNGFPRVDPVSRGHG